MQHDPNLVLSKADGGIALAAFPVRGGLYLHAPDGAILDGPHLEALAQTVATAVDAERERVAQEGPQQAAKPRRACSSCKGSGRLKAMGGDGQPCPVCDGEGSVE